MKTRNKKNDVKKEIIKTNKKVSINNILLFRNSKNNEIIELINEEKNKSVEYQTFIDHIVNLSKLVQMSIISRYRHILKEIPSSQFILDIIIKLPMKDCNPQDNKFINLIYAMWRSELINKN
jgi:predicted ABC-class ATPase